MRALSIDQRAHHRCGIGRAAVACVDRSRYLKSNDVDLIITDLNMPVMGGFVFIEKLREDAKYLATPILIMTTEISKEVKQLGRAVGATGWITKPFHPEKLLAAIRRIVQ